MGNWSEKQEKYIEDKVEYYKSHLHSPYHTFNDVGLYVWKIIAEARMLEEEE